MFMYISIYTYVFGGWEVRKKKEEGGNDLKEGVSRIMELNWLEGREGTTRKKKGTQKGG